MVREPGFWVDGKETTLSPKAVMSTAMGMPKAVIPTAIEMPKAVMPVAMGIPKAVMPTTMGMQRALGAMEDAPSSLSKQSRAALPSGHS